MASSFRLSTTFASNLQTLAKGIDDAAHDAMGKAMAQAEEDAQRLYRWHTPGEYTDIDRSGNLWEWTVSGATAASITGYVVGSKRLKSLPGQATVVTKNGVPFAPHSHGTDPSLTGDYAEQPGVVRGIITIYTAYAPFLQKKEIAGGEWGSPSPGEPVTIDVLDINWEPYYCPHILAPAIERWMQRVAARLR